MIYKSNLATHRLSGEPIKTWYPWRSSWSLCSFVSMVAWQTWLTLEVKIKYSLQGLEWYKHIVYNLKQYLQVDLRYQVDPGKTREEENMSQEITRRSGSSYVGDRMGTCGPGTPLTPGKPFITS